MAGETETLLKSQCTEFSFCSHLPEAPAERGQSGLEMLEESLELVDLVSELKEELQVSLS